MIRINKYLFIVLFALCGIGWTACTQQRDPCLTPLRASLIIVTQHLITDTSTVFVDTALPAAVFVPLTKLASDTGVLYLQQANFTLSLSPDSNICRWAMATDTLNYSKYDTLTFYYQRQLQFISNACGFTYYYNIDSVHTTHFNIDSLHILNASVTSNVNTTQLQICIHPGF